MDLLLDRNRQALLPLRREYGEGSWSIFRIVISRVGYAGEYARRYAGKDGSQPERKNPAERVGDSLNIWKERTLG